MKLLLDFSGLQYLIEKSFIDTNNFMDIDSLFGIASGSERLCVWLRADNVARGCRLAAERYGRQEALHFFIEGFISKCTIIPVRKENILNAVKAEVGDLESNITMFLAGQHNLDCIVTRNPEDYHHGGIRAILPDELPSFFKELQQRDIHRVPFMDLKAQYDNILSEIDERFDHTLAHTQFILGPYVSEFEGRFADLQETRYCVGVSSGTAALHIALMTLDIGVGDLVLLPVNTFIATAEAVSLVGAMPIFIDCDAYYNIDTDKLRETLEGMASKDLKLPKALIPVHLYGQPADMTALMDLAAEFDLAVIEDACQAHLARFEGKTVGRFGQLSAFSFYPGKNLGAFGEAGAVITDDEALYVKAKMLRQHGERERYRHECIGHNYRMSAFQGAVLAVKSKYLSEWTHSRQAVARKYNELLVDVEEIDLPKERRGTECVYHLYVIQADRRDELREFLSQNGIDTGIHYPYPLHQQPAYSHLGYKENDFPVAERAARRILSLPMYPELSERQIIYVSDKIKEFYSKKNSM